MPAGKAGYFDAARDHEAAAASSTHRLGNAPSGAAAQMRTSAASVSVSRSIRDEQDDDV